MQQADRYSLPMIAALGIALTMPQCTISSSLEPQEPISNLKTLPSLTQPSFEQQAWPNEVQPVAQIYIVTIPPGHPIDVAASTDLQTVEEFAAEHNALAVINGGFFDPNNGQTTSFVMINGALVADPRENKRLINNPALDAYIDKILNRSEFRRYQCGDDIHYDITFHNAALPDNCILHSALGAGPQLLPTDTSQTEGFTDYADGHLTRDAIGSQQPNARSAVGIKEDGTVVWVMVAQADATGGMTLGELAEFMAKLNVQQALNLDGGSSSSLNVDQQLNSSAASSTTVSTTRAPSTYPSLNSRPVKSVLLLPQQSIPKN
ncbi:MAG: phosphodiester glycosidase family protein [Cyanobacteria bacterium P01_D01_bin.156]